MSSRNGLVVWTERFGLPIILPILVIALWQYVGQADILAGGLFPSASESALALYHWIFGGGAAAFSAQWLGAVATSALRVAIGFAIGTLAGTVMGLTAGTSTLIRRLFDPSINAMRPISVTAWVPMALILFGIGLKPAVFLIALATFYPVYINVLSGARYSEGKMVRAAEMLGANRRVILLKVILPATLPSIATGMRVGAAIAWTALVVAELIGAKSGLGYTLIFSYNQFRFDYVVAAMLSVGACGYVSDKLLEFLVERRLKWAVRGSAAR